MTVHENLDHGKERQGGDLTGYQAGRISLDLSECANRLGPPPSTLRAVMSQLTHNPGALRSTPYQAVDDYAQAYARHLGVPWHELVCGRGVSEFLLVLSDLLSAEDVGLLTPEYTETLRRFAFATFYPPDAGRPDSTEHRLERLRRAMQAHRYVLISNPNNPLGHYIAREDLLAACRAFPRCSLIVDESYIEFVGPDLSLATHPAPASRPRNVVILQSTGKAWGLAGTRGGILWTRDSDLAHRAELRIPSWPLSANDVAGLKAALADTTWLHRTLHHIRRQATQLEDLLRHRFGGAVVTSQIHYRFVHHEQPAAVAEHLAEHAIAVRTFDGTERGRTSGLRVSAPTNTDEYGQLERALASLPSSLVPHPGRVYPAGTPYLGKAALAPLPQTAAT
ncbi:aminotransferase class I/II-fold pyridoxal phosphate-dependent enzyme [Streptomyces spectabilis]|uniref:Histidinol-phosphate aminotransferase n=1 Tax=Streptomyces spectabilis TaxID=68270 RepID=A0A7W8EZY0_STRST|nr:aminotransferase class I/II-fold pyridoxal phosphate-dependent enzyme [Streptomyces spectabilis]MBB5109858.1 histidinol-phosphate aminotransferase [Streptomyces spectabilis]GGV55844.1 threonine-phosphate decarboxylase [Streptomyces spectabilis]